MKIVELLNEYLLEMEVKGLSKHTIRGAEETIYQLMKTCDIENVDEITVINIKRFIKIKQETMKASSINSRLRHFKMLFRFMIDEDYIDINPMDRIKMVKAEKKVIKTYSTNDIDKILSYYNGKSFMHIRNKTMIMMYIECGIRSTELRTIRCEDVYDGSIHILGKGNKIRYVPISLPLKRQLIRYERARKVFMNKPSRYLKANESEWYFVGKSRNQLHITIPLAIINKMNIDISVKPTVHHFRRYYAQQMLKKVDLYTLSRLLGHGSVMVTQKYIEGIEDEEIIKSGMNSPLTKRK